MRNTVRLRFLCECLDGQRIPLNVEQRADRRGQYPYWGANGVVDYIDEYLFNEPLVLLGEDGAPFFDNQKDKAFFVNHPVWVNNHIHVLRPRKDVIGKYLAYALNSIEYSPYIEGSTRDKLTQDKMKEIVVPMPGSASLQRLIADYLDRETARIDALVAEKEKMLALLEEKRAALISRAVTKGLNPDAPMKPSGLDWLGEIPEHWEVNYLKYLAEVRGGLTLGKKYSRKDLVEVAYLRVANVQDGYLNLNNMKTIEVTPEEFEKSHGQRTGSAGSDHMAPAHGQPDPRGIIDQAEKHLWKKIQPIQPG